MVSDVVRCGDLLGGANCPLRLPPGELTNQGPKGGMLGYQPGLILGLPYREIFGVVVGGSVSSLLFWGVRYGKLSTLTDGVDDPGIYNRRAPSVIVPSKIMSSFPDWPDEDHLAILREKNAPAHQIEMSTKELQRRYLSRIAEETRRLNSATESLTATTKRLVEATEKVHREVGLLANSSTRIENLTRTLKVLTVVAIIFFAAQIGIAIVQTWKMFHRNAKFSDGAAHCPPLRALGH